MSRNESRVRGYRFMRIITMFDLPSVTSQELRIYRKFRQFLIEDGFAMLQESIYTKLVLNNTQVETVRRRIESNAPVRGAVFVMVVTEKQFGNMWIVSGEVPNKQLQTDQRLVIL